MPSSPAAVPVRGTSADPSGTAPRPRAAALRDHRAASARAATAVAALALLVAGCSGGDTADPAPSTSASSSEPAPSSSSSTAPAVSSCTPATSTISAREAGAVGDGTTDDTAAIQAALDALTDGQRLVLDEGATFAVSDVVTLSVPGTGLEGPGTLLATDEELSSFEVTADDAVLDGFTLTVEPTTARFDAFEQQRLHLAGTTGVRVCGVTVDGSAAAGVYVGGASTDFLLEDVVVKDTRADGIHITQGSSNGTVTRPLIERSGDDGVAVVSYAVDGAPSTDITVDSPVVRTTTGGRGISVVGGQDVTYTDIDIEGSAAAAVYISSEESYDTLGVSGVTVTGGTISGANTDAGIDHGSILVFQSSGLGIDDVTISGITVTDTRPGASREVGVLGGDGDGTTGVTLSDLTFEGGPETLLVEDGTVSGLTTDGWTLDGDAVEDPLAG